MTTSPGERGGKRQWKGALYSGKRAKLRKIAFKPATRAESGKLLAQGSPTNGVRAAGDKKKQQNGRSGHGHGHGGSSGSSVEELASWHILFRPGAGLHNLGNTCFMNSVLQCLTYTPPLAQTLLRNPYGGSGSGSGSSEGGGKFDVMQIFSQHVNTVLRSPGAVVPPHKFSRSLRMLSSRFRLGRQEDAHEYFRCLVESMEKSYTSKVSKKPTQEQIEQCFIYQVFGGKLRSQIHCTACNYKSNKYDPILDLNLEIFRTRSLERALNMFTSKEVLDGSNKYNCPKCKNMVKAVKQMLLCEAPNILAIQLKRFAFGKYGMKIENMVTFPARLDMSKYICGGKKQGPIMYSLYGILVHSGHSIHSGHYYCFVKCPSGAWVCCDDGYVHQVSEKKVLEQKAYMLFYSKESSAGSGAARMGIQTLGSSLAVKEGKKSIHSSSNGGGRVASLRADDFSAGGHHRPGSSSSSSLSPPGSPRSPPGSPGSPRALARTHSHSLQRGVSMSPSLQKSRWKRFLVFLPRMRLQVAGGMKQVVKELIKNRPKRRRSLEGSSVDGDLRPRRSTRLQLKRKKKPEAAAEPRRAGGEDSRKKMKNSKEPPQEQEQAPASGSGTFVKDARSRAEVRDWLQGDRGVGPYGVPVKKWEGADAEASHQADKLFRSMKPVQKRRDRYDEEYDMGKVKKVKAKVKAGRKRLGNQSSAFQRAAKGKFDARSRRKNSSHH